MKEKKGTYKSLWTVLRYVGNWRTMAALLVVSLCCTVRNVLTTVSMSYATDQVLEGGRVVTAVLFMLVTMFGGAPFIAMRSYFSDQYYLKARERLQLGIGRRIAGLPLGWVESHKKGDVQSTYTGDMEELCGWLCWGFPEMVRFGSYLIGALIFALSQSVMLTVWVFPVIIIIVPLLTKLAQPIQKLSDEKRKAAADAIVDMQEILADPEYLKAYHLEDTMGNRIERALVEKRRAEQKAGIFNGLVQALGTFGSYLPGFVAAAAGVYFMSKGEISAGFLIGFVQIAVQNLGKTLPDISAFVAENNKAGASAKRVLELLRLPQERADGEAQICEEMVAAEKTALALEHVNFYYRSAEAKVLHDVNLQVQVGETVALVGSSGSGKSTVLKLLMGLYEAQEGSVKVQGRDVKQWNLVAMRSLMSPVFQDAALFPLTIRENIADGTVCDEEVWAALENAGLKEYVEALEEGLAAVVGENGVTLSGGQQQRLTIARAFVKDAPIILLDEPTSALDSVTEREFQAAFDALKRGRTTVVVAHRLQTIRNADRIYVFDKGRIVQEGNHETLITQEGAYRRLYQAQLEECSA